MTSHSAAYTGIAAAATYAALGLCAHRNLLGAMNRRARSAMLRTRKPRVVRVAKTVTVLSEPVVHPMLAFAASLAVSRLNGRATWAPLVASLAVFAVNKGTRLFVRQQRPPLAKPRTGLDRLGFPSGHTLAATAIAFTTALELAERRSPGARAALLAAASAYAAAIGWTRLTLDEHWLDDVLGAWAGGIALAIVVTALTP